MSGRRLISTGSPFERTAGYSRAVVQGDWCFVSGTTGYDYATMTMPEGVEAQARKPVLSAAVATTWAMLRALDLDTRVPGGGTLLSGAY